MRTRTRASAAVSTLGTMSNYVRSPGRNGQPDYPSAGAPKYDINNYTSAGVSVNNGISAIITDECPEYDRYGNCKHTVDELLFLDTTTVAYPRRYVYTTNHLTVEYRDVNAWYWANYAYRSNGVPTALNPTPVFTENWETMSAQAVQSMLPSFNDGNSLVNFVLELKDLRKIPDLWKPKRNKLLGRPPESWLKPRRKGDSDLLKSITRSNFVRDLSHYLKGGVSDAAAVQLTWAFGVLPFVSDVSNMFDTLKAFRKKLRRLIELNGKPITRHYAAPMPYSKLPSAYVHTAGGTWTDHRGTAVEYRVHVKHEWVETPMYHASMRFVYALPDMSSIDNQMKAFLDALGVRPDPSIVWNATRLSFLVDWVVGVGKWLESLSVDNLEIPAVIEDFCHSVKYSTKGIATVQDYFWTAEVIHSSRSYYERKRVIPHSLSTIKTSGVNGREARLGSALLVANWKPRWTRKGGRWLRS